MTASLEQLLLSPEAKPRVLQDCYALIDQQVSEQSGMSGTAVKIAYKTVNTFMPGHVRSMVGKLLPQLVHNLEPFWAEFQASGSADFGDYLSKRGDEVAQALLAVTDARAASSGRPTVIKAYGSVRGSAAKHVQAALPQVGALIIKYAA